MGSVLSVASECAPLVKTGGLADVAGALPGALAPLDWSMRTLMPAYPGLLDRLEGAEELCVWPSLLGTPARLVAGRVAGLDLLLLDAPELFDREGGIYLGPDGKDWPDNPRRYAALCHVAAFIGSGGLEGWKPDVVHLHDWQAAPTALLLIGSGVPTVITVHNIAFQGLAGASLIGPLGLPPHHFRADGYEYYGNISFLKAGLVFADAVTTVSPTYARELLTSTFGMGLEGVLRSRGAALSGILNGVDTDVWNPATDPLIARTYNATTVEAGKAENRAALEAEFGLEPGDGPVFGVVSRLTSQKGLDLLLGAVPGLLDAGGRLVLIGSGDPGAERAWRSTAARAPGRVGVFIGYDENASHRLFAGADAVLVPSRFEPCGLTQLYALRYGAVPVVARTGGLADTVIDANDAALRAGVATGFMHEAGESPETAIRRACAAFAAPQTRDRMRANGMAHPVDWSVSARDYAALYARLAGAAA